MPSLAEPRRWGLPSEAASNGCFETMRAYRGRIFRLDAHLDRLYASAQFLGTRAPSDRRGLRVRLLDALARARLREAVVRVALMPRPRREAEPVIMVQAVVPPPPSAYARGIHVAIVPTRTFPVSAVDAQAKYSARLGSVLAIMDAQVRRAEEALFMDTLGYVTESTASNVGMVKRGVLLTPPCALGLLAGITRDVLLEAARAVRASVEEIPLTRHDLYNADEAFLSSTIKEVLSVVRIDGRQIGTGRPGPLARQLRRAFHHIVRRELRLSGNVATWQRGSTVVET